MRLITSQCIPFLAGILLLLGLLTATLITSAQTPDRVSQWRPLIQQIAAVEGVDPLLVEAMVAVESGGNPNAHSPAGAVGLMQVMPATARLYGVHGAALWQPAVNIRIGARYLRDELAACDGDVTCALAGYNGGPRARFGHRYAETRAYVRNVLAVYQRLQPPPAPEPRGSRYATVSVEW